MPDGEADDGHARLRVPAPRRQQALPHPHPAGKINKTCMHDFGWLMCGVYIELCVYICVCVRVDRCATRRTHTPPQPHTHPPTTRNKNAGAHRVSLVTRARTNIIHYKPPPPLQFKKNNAGSHRADAAARGVRDGRVPAGDQRGGGRHLLHRLRHGGRHDPQQGACISHFCLVCFSLGVGSRFVVGWCVYAYIRIVRQCTRSGQA